MNRIITTFGNRQHELSIIVSRVLDKMENNEFFPHPPAALKTLKALAPEYNISLRHAKSRDKEMVAIKNNKKAGVVALLQELADYVTAICKEDLLMLLSSGFDISTEDNSKGRLSGIEKLEVALGDPGEATTKVRNTKGARAYMHQYTTEPPGPKTIWITEGIALSKYTFVGLHSDKRHWFRVVAIGSGTRRTYSPIVSRVIQ